MIHLTARAAIQPKASAPKRSPRIGNMEIPAGYVVRRGQRLIARPIRTIGSRDESQIQLAVESFGFLLKPGAVLTLAGFASCIELHCSDLKARHLADTLHRLSA